MFGWRCISGAFRTDCDSEKIYVHYYFICLAFIYAFKKGWHVAHNHTVMFFFEKLNNSVVLIENLFYIPYVVPCHAQSNE